MMIAVDGTAASGKGTLAKRLAAHYGLGYLDSGSLYRAVAAAVLAAGGDPADPGAALAAARSLDAATTDGDALRAQHIGKAASLVAAIPEVRAALLDYQRAFARRGAVIDGRDIGTVVAPDADAKLFVTASLEERTRRRTAELAALGQIHDEAAIRADLAARDHRDSTRAVAPLRPAADALLLDTTDLDIEAAFRAALALVEGRLDTAAKGCS